MREQFSSLEHRIQGAALKKFVQSEEQRKILIPPLNFFLSPYRPNERQPGSWRGAAECCRPVHGIGMDKWWARLHEAVDAIAPRATSKATWLNEILNGMRSRAIVRFGALRRCGRPYGYLRYLQRITVDGEGSATLYFFLASFFSHLMKGTSTVFTT